MTHQTLESEAASPEKGVRRKETHPTRLMTPKGVGGFWLIMSPPRHLLYLAYTHKFGDSGRIF